MIEISVLAEVDEADTERVTNLVMQLLAIEGVVRVTPVDIDFV